MSYRDPDPIDFTSENTMTIINIPSFQQRMLADRKFFSLKDGVTNRIDVDQTMANNGRIVLTALAKLLQIKGIAKLKKHDLAALIQARIRFL